MDQTEEIASLPAPAPMRIMRMSVKERYSGGGPSAGIPHWVGLVRAQT